MFFKIRKVRGKLYLYRLKSYREEGAKMPKHDELYVGPIRLVQDALRRWGDKHGE